jgi:hypothetical protein
MDDDSIRSWSTANHMKIYVSKTRVISVNRKTSMITFEYKLCGSRINRTDTFKGLGIILNSKLYFHQHVDYILSQTFKLLSLICAVTFSFHLYTAFSSYILL